jgi:uncharacterized membrane protein
MKFLKYLLYLILVLLVLFIALGLLKPSISYGHEISVDKPLKEAWAVSQDETKLDQWLKGFKSIELISGESGEDGSKYKVIVNPGEGQKDFEMIETQISKEEFDHISQHFDSDMMDFDQTMSFSETNGKTTLKTESSVKGKGLMMRSMFALMHLTTDSFQKQEAENIENLKKVIEANTTDYYPAPVINTVEENLSEEEE